MNIPNLGNKDSIGGRPKSNFVVSSVDNDITGSLNITNSGFINITRGHLWIDGEASSISKDDHAKLNGSNVWSTIPNKVVLYDNRGKILTRGFSLRANNGSLMNILLRDQTRGEHNVIIKNLGGNDSEFVLTTTDQTKNNTETFTSPVVCT